jgi:hypothetical protein
MVIGAPLAGRITMNPTAADIAALGWVTANAKAVATAASIAFPPFRRIAAPTSDAGAEVVMTMPWLELTGAPASCAKSAGVARIAIAKVAAIRRCGIGAVPGRIKRVPNGV